MRFVPDRIFDRLDAITPEVARAAHIRGLVIDIDYTMAPRDVPLPDDGTVRFIRRLRQAGIRLHILSNNHKGRVSRFADALKVPYTCNAMKPFPQAYRRAVESMGLRPDEAAAVGDQIYTDVFGAHLAGLRAWMVRPVGKGSSVFYHIRRGLEQPFIRRYYRMGGE